MLFALIVALAHVLAVLSMAATGPTSEIKRFYRSAQKNQFTVLPPISPDTQPLPFMMPESVYAICPFDVSRMPVRLNVKLPDEGWQLSLHGLDGGSFYLAPGAPEEPLELTLDVVPSGDELNGLELAARPEDMKIAKVDAPASRGFAIIRAPIVGRAFIARAIAALDNSTCKPIGQSLQRRSARR